MTDESIFATLEDAPLREAWAHEARQFTPWLAANLDRLSLAVGIRAGVDRHGDLVEGFAADIIARNPKDDTKVLIENQLAASDHGHLGQIMTYLAGLERAHRALGRARISRASSLRNPLAQREHYRGVRLLRDQGSGRAR